MRYPVVIYPFHGENPGLSMNPGMFKITWAASDVQEMRFQEFLYWVPLVMLVAYDILKAWNQRKRWKIWMPSWFLLSHSKTFLQHASGQFHQVVQLWPLISVSISDFKLELSCSLTGVCHCVLSRPRGPLSPCLPQQLNFFFHARTPEALQGLLP